MIWHRANRRRGRRLELASVDYLGDIPGEALLPMRPVYMPRDRSRCFACRKTHRMMGVIGLTIVTLLFCIHVVMLFSW